MSEDDRHLVWRQQAGDYSAFEELHARHGRRVTAYLLRSGFSRSEADDLCQEVFLRAFKSLGSFDADRGSLGTWLGAIARNVARRQWRRRARPEGFDGELAEETFAADNPRAAPEVREELQAVRDCVAALPAELGRIGRLRYIDARTTRGIAEVTDTPEATVRARLAEAKGMVERCLRGKGVLE